MDHHSDLLELDRPGPAQVDARSLAPTWVAPVFVVLAAGLVPWIVTLGVWLLPSRSVASHYALAWVGFDVLLLASLAGVASTAWRGSPRLHGLAMAAAALLVVDAWFDVTTATGPSAFWQAVAEALVVELPLAALNFWVAEHAERVIARCRAMRRVDPTNCGDAT